MLASQLADDADGTETTVGRQEEYMCLESEDVTDLHTTSEIDALASCFVNGGANVLFSMKDQWRNQFTIADVIACESREPMDQQRVNDLVYCTQEKKRVELVCMLAKLVEVEASDVLRTTPNGNVDLRRIESLYGDVLHHCMAYNLELGTGKIALSGHITPGIAAQVWPAIYSWLKEMDLALCKEAKLVNNLSEADADLLEHAIVVLSDSLTHRSVLSCKLDEREIQKAIEEEASRTMGVSTGWRQKMKSTRCSVKECLSGSTGVSDLSSVWFEKCLLCIFEQCVDKPQVLQELEYEKRCVGSLEMFLRCAAINGKEGVRAFFNNTTMFRLLDNTITRLPSELVQKIYAQRSKMRPFRPPHEIFMCLAYACKEQLASGLQHAEEGAVDLATAWADGLAEQEAAFLQKVLSDAKTAICKLIEKLSNNWHVEDCFVHTYREATSTSNRHAMENFMPRSEHCQLSKQFVMLKLEKCRLNVKLPCCAERTVRLLCTLWELLGKNELPPGQARANVVKEVAKVCRLRSQRVMNSYDLACRRLQMGVTLHYVVPTELMKHGGPYADAVEDLLGAFSKFSIHNIASVLPKMPDSGGVVAVKNIAQNRRQVMLYSSMLGQLDLLFKHKSEHYRDMAFLGRMIQVFFPAIQAKRQSFSRTVALPNAESIFSDLELLSQVKKWIPCQEGKEEVVILNTDLVKLPSGVAKEFLARVCNTTSLSKKTKGRPSKKAGNAYPLIRTVRRKGKKCFVIYKKGLNTALETTHAQHAIC